MKHSNISIFIPHIGCPHLCSFCDQRTISGAQTAPSGEDVREICKEALAQSRCPENGEIAFFGGSFTAIAHDYMCELLDAAQPFIGDGKFRGIRISTRPDCISDDVLDTLKGYGVTSIELGAQSMCDSVLEANGRGHTAEDVNAACRLIRAHCFELGLQMMMGLYGSSVADELETVKRIAELRPDTVRIYPVVILKNTRLGELYLSGEYKTLSFDEIVSMASAAMAEFERCGIRVIKCGLHASEFVEKDMLGGFYHPAFRELCEGLIYRKNIERLLDECGISCGEVVLAVAERCMSRAMGHKKANAIYFDNRGIRLRFTEESGLEKYQIKLRR